MVNRKTKKDPRNKVPVQTTFFDLIGELSRLTDDDHIVMEAVKNIFKSYRVKFTHSPAPVRLVATGRAAQSPMFQRQMLD